MGIGPYTLSKQEDVKWFLGQGRGTSVGREGKCSEMFEQNIQYLQQCSESIQIHQDDFSNSLK